MSKDYRTYLASHRFSNTRILAMELYTRTQLLLAGDRACNQQSLFTSAFTSIDLAQQTSKDIQRRLIRILPADTIDKIVILPPLQAVTDCNFILRFSENIYIIGCQCSQTVIPVILQELHHNTLDILIDLYDTVHTKPLTLTNVTTVFS
jgi:hypothetical protein